MKKPHDPIKSCMACQLRRERKERRSTRAKAGKLEVERKAGQAERRYQSALEERGQLRLIPGAQ